MEYWVVGTECNGEIKASLINKITMHSNVPEPNMNAEKQLCHKTNSLIQLIQKVNAQTKLPAKQMKEFIRKVLES